MTESTAQHLDPDISACSIPVYSPGDAERFQSVYLPYILSLRKDRFDSGYLREGVNRIDANKLVSQCGTLYAEVLRLQSELDMQSARGPCLPTEE